MSVLQQEQAEQIAEYVEEDSPAVVVAEEKSEPPPRVTAEDGLDDGGEYDSYDPDYIAEEDSLVSVEVRYSQQAREETYEEKQKRFQQAVDSMPKEVTKQLDELLRGHYVVLKKIPRSEWI